MKYITKGVLNYMEFTPTYIQKLNKDIETYTAKYPERKVHLIEEGMNTTFKGISNMVMLDRYVHNDSLLETLTTGDFVLLTVKDDPKYPTRGTGTVVAINGEEVTVQVSEDYIGQLENNPEGILVKPLQSIQKPLELFYEQVAKRNAEGLSANLKDRESYEARFEQVLKDRLLIPAGRVLSGAGSGTAVTYFNCYVMPFISDSRGGISDHRKKTMEIMSRGGGVGTNGSTLRPRNAAARGVNGRSSGAVSWLNDLANLTNLVEQGGSRRGAQMIMMADWHSDIAEFIISKMQNPKILKFIMESIDDKHIQELAKAKLKFVPMAPEDKAQFEFLRDALFNKQVLHQLDPANPETSKAEKEMYQNVETKLADGGTWTVHNPDFLTGANISVALTKEFMHAVENDLDYDLRFPDVQNYTPDEMKAYDELWHTIGDVREWEKMGFAIRTYRTVRAKNLWTLINICATYSAEPGVFFMDTANDMTNATAYGQKVVATNPCGEQPLAPYSVCNLSALNLAGIANFGDKTFNKELLIATVKTAIRMQDSVIDTTPYFLEENKKQALGERRIGLGVMGLADLLIILEKKYGSPEGNEVVNEVFETIKIAAYEESIEIAKEQGSFSFLVGETEEETYQLRMKFVNTGFMKKMPNYIRQAILENGIRNSHLLTVAPTGSTGTMIGCSTGLEPYFSFSYFRSGRLGDFIEVKADIVEDYLTYAGLPLDTPLNELPEFFVGSMDLKPEHHVDVQCIIQEHVDSSLSKTVNAPKGYSVSQVEEVYNQLWKGGAKGGTVYVDGSRDTQVLNLGAEETADEQIEYQPETIGTGFLNTSRDAVVYVEYGSEPGDTCPVCKVGIVEDLGGCSTCTNCKAQLKCGV